MIIETLSTFPQMYDSVMGSSMMRLAQEKGILQFAAYDLRNWTHDRHRTTDDDPYGGGLGLVMKCEPIFEAYDDIAAAPLWPVVAPSVALSEQVSPCADGEKVCMVPEGNGMPNASSCGYAVEMPCAPYTIFLAPHGTLFNDSIACELTQQKRILFVCGHYEGIDERAYDLADRILSLGDYVVTSGELASMVIIDAVVRKLPGVLGAKEGALEESFVGGLLEYPQYTRPAQFRGREVPPLLLSGDHAAVARWRREASLERTARLRPDLLEGAQLSKGDQVFLKSLSTEFRDFV